MTKARVNADNASADIQGVTAGIGLTGGGTSGTVTLDVNTTTIQTRVANVTDTEIGYLDGVTSAIQTQIDGKQAVVSGVSSTEIGYLDGVTSAIQTQLDGKINNTLTTTTGDIIYASGANTPARRAIGSTGQVLTVSGGVPTWATPAGGAYTQLSSAAYSGATSYTLSGISSSYKFLRLVVRNYSASANAGQILFRMNSDTNNHASNTASSENLTANQSVWNPCTYGSNTADNNNTFIIDFPNYADTSTSAKFGNMWSLYRRQAQTFHVGQVFVGFYNSSSAISSITILETGGAGTNFSIGNATLYGVN